jgi:hypothetical protein
MKPRTTLVLAVLAVVIIGLAWYFGARATRPAVVSEAGAGKPAFADAAPRLQNAAVIELAHQGNKIVLARKGDVWGVAQDSGYPAEAGKVHDLLAGLAELKLMEPRTSDPAEYNRLGVADPGLKSDSTMVAVEDGAGKPILALIVGHSRTRGMSNLPDQIYVRRPGEAQSWLAEGRLPLDDDALMWLDRSIINIDHAKIARVVADRPGQRQIELVRERGKLVMKQPGDHPPLDPAKLSDVANSLEFLSFLRVQPGTALPGKELGHSRFTTTEGMAVAVVVNQKGNEVWARFTTTGDGAAKPEAQKLEAKLGTGCAARDGEIISFAWSDADPRRHPGQALRAGGDTGPDGRAIQLTEKRRWYGYREATLRPGLAVPGAYALREVSLRQASATRR